MLLLVFLLLLLVFCLFVKFGLVVFVCLFVVCFVI